jgi:hypothetical protein
MALAVGRGERFDHRQRCRNGRNAQPAGETVLERVHLLPHRPAIANDAPRPIEDPLAFRRKVLKSRAAIDQKDTERIFQLFDASRQSGLRDAASFGGAGEILFARQGKEKFKLIDQDRAPTQGVSPRRN